MLRAVLISLLPAAAVVIGGLLALRLKLSAQQLSFTLHFAAGVVLAVVGVELMPRALGADPAWVAVAAFVAGGVFYVLSTLAADRLADRSASGGGAGRGAAWAIVIGIGLDLVTDGIMVAAGESIGGGLGILLGLGLFVADLPEAFAAIASVKADLGQRTSLLIVVTFAVLVVAGAPVGYLAVSGQSDLVQFAIASATAGMLVLVVVEGLVPEAHSLTRRHASVAGTLFILGFALFTGLSVSPLAG